MTSFPWVFEKGGRPSLIILTLEALAVQMALKVFYKEDVGPRRKKVLVMPTCTDGRGNVTPRAQCSWNWRSQMKAMALKVQVELTPRSGNQ